MTMRPPLRPTLLARLRARRVRPALDAYAARYDTAPSATAAAAAQLVALNASWTASLARSPWARALRTAFMLPERFESWAAFEAAVPPMSKDMLRPVVEAGSAARASGAAAAPVWRATGGSTAEPFRFPCWPDEAGSAGLDIWLGRRRLGVDPDDRLFLIWGHAHLLGSGWRGRVNRVKRTASDRLLGYTRYSAYDLADADLERACAMLLRARPAYVVGYSTALDRFARVNAGRAGDIAALALRAVIATAEAFPWPDSRAAVEACFGAPVAMEYGTVETGPLAYENPVDGPGYDVFWARNRVERRGGAGAVADELLVTSLEPRALPLLRYALGDLAEASAAEAAAPCLRRLEGVIGRCNDVIRLPNGAMVHSEAFTHCLRELAEVRAFQVVAPGDAVPWIRYEARDALREAVATETRRRFAAVDPSLADIRLERVDTIALSTAGKHRMVVEG